MPTWLRHSWEESLTRIRTAFPVLGHSHPPQPGDEWEHWAPPAMERVFAGYRQFHESAAQPLHDEIVRRAPFEVETRESKEAPLLSKVEVIHYKSAPAPQEDVATAIGIAVPNAVAEVASPSSSELDPSLLQTDSAKHLGSETNTAVLPTEIMQPFLPRPPPLEKAAGRKQIPHHRRLDRVS